MEIISPRKKGASRVIEEDDEDVEDTNKADAGGNIDESVTKGKRGRGRPKGPQKQGDKEVAKKIKDMAEAMKKRLEDSKKKTEQTSENPKEADLSNTSTGDKSKEQKNRTIKKEMNSQNTNAGPKLVSQLLSATIDDTASKTESSAKTVKPEVIFGADSILHNSSEFRPRADVNKGSIIGNDNVNSLNCIRLMAYGKVC